QKMQLRILGSVRYLVVYDEIKLQSKNTFNTSEIPTPTTGKIIPNYYNGLEQTRLGFEITRKTEKGNVFIRLETDFAGPNGYRIRHAYGQMGSFLFGQTWSLFSHINALPPLVNFSGPTGSVVVRTPQIRYSIPKVLNKTNIAVGLEFFPPDLNIPDSLQIESFQLTPDITLRADRTFEWGSAQLSGILPILSGRNGDNLGVITGWGLSGSTILNSWYKGKWYIQGVLGKAISRYFTEFEGQGYDIQFLPGGNYTSPYTFGFYTTYAHQWKASLSSNFTYGYVSLEKKSFTEENIYNKGHTMRMNTFWDITDGAKTGAEITWGKRVNKNEVYGNALRFNLLFYYDF
ncbi:DcaP family trimeric outer membrane transporter, partial [Algoriphagus sp.]|uniref:DcaP family trimeric outer membrane transporter n=1 Tax=Algoriphagus sp. TaxID=1872435 RepID=UPI0025FF86EC